MKDSVLLSLKVGVPLAAIAVVLLFRLETLHTTDRTSSLLLKTSAVVAVVATATLAVLRFALLS